MRAKDKPKKQLARILRKQNTEAEASLWNFLRNRQLNGYKFKRQEIFSPYIVDFVCHHKKLIIELDGGQHAEAISYDEQRTAFLNSKGYRVIRFWNHQIFEEIEDVLSDIFDALEGEWEPL